MVGNQCSRLGLGNMIGEEGRIFCSTNAKHISCYFYFIFHITIFEIFGDGLPSKISLICYRFVQIFYMINGNVPKNSLKFNIKIQYLEF